MGLIFLTKISQKWLEISFMQMWYFERHLAWVAIRFFCSLQMWYFELHLVLVDM